MTRSAPRVNGRFAIHMTKCRPLHPEMPCEICREDPGARMAAGRSDRRKRGRTRTGVLPMPQIWGLNSIPRRWHMLHMDARKPILRTPTESLDQGRPAAILSDPEAFRFRRHPRRVAGYRLSCRVASTGTPGTCQPSCGAVATRAGCWSLTRRFRLCRTCRSAPAWSGILPSFRPTITITARF